MSGSQKVYVIDPGTTKSYTGSASSGKNGEETPGYLQSSGSRDGSGNRQSGVPLILSYMAGPLSIMATRRGRKSRFWSGMAILSIALSAVVVWMWRGLSWWSTANNPMGAVMILMAAAAAVAGCSAWTRAVISAGRYEGPRIRRSPGWLKSPFAAGLFGILSPGMGLFLSVRTRRAAAAIWMACLTVISLLILLRASWLWRFNEHAGAFSVEPDTLEYVFMIAAAAAVAGGLAWIFQALNGARLAGRANSRKTVSRGNWAAVALLISIVAFATLSQPALVAESLGEAAEAASAEGMRIIPLYMAKAAVRLDPSRPEYTIGVIGLLEGSGETAAADAARRELVARLEPTISLLEVEGLVSPVSRDGAEAVVPAAPLFEKHGPVTSTRVPAELMILEGRM